MNNQMLEEYMRLLLAMKIGGDEGMGEPDEIIVPDDSDEEGQDE